MKHFIFLTFILTSLLSAGDLPFAERHEDKIDALAKSLKCCWTKKELMTLFANPEAHTMDKATMYNLRFILTPRSIHKQKKQHSDFIPKLVNEKTVLEGKEFFKKYEKTLKSAFCRYKVVPQDIIAVLNWESKLGKIVGDQSLVKIFVGQYFLATKIEAQFFREGVYKREGALPRSKSLRRIERLKKRSFRNLSALLRQSKKRGFDPLSVKGSWAGAIGFPQFMPSSMRFAVDGNGDGVIDLFVMEDAIMSVASFLYGHSYIKRGHKHSFKRYNPDDMYVRGVTLYREMAQKAGINAKAWKCVPK
ncbi:lytic murein transglycosylase [bacterium]|nr:lytic murein transglycosylase [bacterium]